MWMGIFLLAFGFGLIAMTFYSVVINPPATNEEYKNSEEYKKMMRNRFNKRQELDKQNVCYCPKCLSTSISLTNSKQNGIKRAIVGGILAGGVGSVIGALTAKDKTSRYCLKCGHKW